MAWEIGTDRGLVMVKMTSRTNSKTSLLSTTGKRRGLPALYRLPEPPNFPVPKKLDPYLNYSTLKLIQKQPSKIFYNNKTDSARRNSRATATGICDPFKSLAMDMNKEGEGLPNISDDVALINSPQGSRRRACGGSVGGSARSRKEGSTMLPKYPIVAVPRVELGGEPVYDKLHLLRKKIKQNMDFIETNKAREDYKRTTQDYYRMHLDRFDKLHPTSVGRVKDIYLAYFTNTPGSKRAIHDCLNNSDCEQC